MRLSFPLESTKEVYKEISLKEDEKEQMYKSK